MAQQMKQLEQFKSQLEEQSKNIEKIANSIRVIGEHVANLSDRMTMMERKFEQKPELIDPRNNEETIGYEIFKAIIAKTQKNSVLQLIIIISFLSLSDLLTIFGIPLS